MYNICSYEFVYFDDCTLILSGSYLVTKRVATGAMKSNKVTAVIRIRSLKIIWLLPTIMVDTAVPVVPIEKAIKAI